ncbi:MAG: hypothetical protein L3J71_01260 [Victivallaceae bacterium]|nr:hypothetical protein [Victivallaceae bacterium]
MTKYFLLLFFLVVTLFTFSANAKKHVSVAPVSGYFGFSLDWNSDSPEAVVNRLGIKPKVYARFFAFPMSEADVITLNKTVALVKAQGAYLFVTLEPWGGLSSVTLAEAERHANIFKKTRASIFLRFGHEMNGSWYPWSQQPTEYKQAFVMIADAIHRLTRGRVAMVWSPNYGGGYPFTGGAYSITSNSPDFEVLDTNSDGIIDAYDNPYEPYYPGDGAVDWVAMSLYHWGSSYPWGENEIPEVGKFAAQITGTYNGFAGDNTMLPDFYQAYAVDKGKPMAIPETAAFFVPSLGSPSELESLIKQEWWNQLFSQASRTQFPEIKMIIWFEWLKPESSIKNTVVDWRIITQVDILKDLITVLKDAGLGI